MKQTRLQVDAIRIDGGTQPRVAISESHVADIVEAMRENEDGVPPIDVFFDGAEYWLADGFHRWHAARKLELTGIYANLHEGTRRDAVLFSVGVNQGHGLKRTNDDKRKAVMTLLNDSEWSKWSGSEIARRCGVGHTMVNEMKASLAVAASEPPKPRVFVTKHGTESTMNVASIGRREPASRGESEPTKVVPIQRPRDMPPPPPANGLQFARIAIMKLEEIRDNDLERQQAFTLVRSWLDAREAKAAMHS